MLKNKVEWVILVLLFILLVSIQHVNGQTVEEEAQSVIANVEGQIRAATDDLHFYWENITDVTRYEVLSDIQKAWECYWGAKGLYNIGLYNESLRESYWAIFLSHRAIHRIFLNIAETHIEAANSTINDIPSYIPQPTEAKKKLEQASELYEEAYLTEIFRGLPSTEIAIDWINAIYYAQNKLYWNHDTNVVTLADEAKKDAIAWRESHEEALRQIIEEEINGVLYSFYSQLVIPFAVDLSFSLVFLVPIIRRLYQRWMTKSSRKTMWNGNLWNSKWVWGSIIPTLGTLAIFCGLLWDWIQSIHGLSRIYEVSIPTDLVGIVSLVLWVVISLLLVLSMLFGINKFRWQKTTGLMFTIILILEIALSLIAIYLSCLSIGQIHHIVLS